MRARWCLLLACLLSAPAMAALYKHVDAAGKVTYTDRPPHPEAQPLDLPPPNVATPEARRQLDLARQAWDREEREEYEARMRRWAAAQRAAPASRTLTRTSAPAYPYAAYPYYGAYVAPVAYHPGHARIPADHHPPQGLRPAPVPHRAGSPRR